MGMQTTENKAVIGQFNVGLHIQCEKKFKNKPKDAD
jgi:hypothetical protein